MSSVIAWLGAHVSFLSPQQFIEKLISCFSPEGVGQSSNLFLGHRRPRQTGSEKYETKRKKMMII
jgi:hypothetical protein